MTDATLAGLLLDDAERYIRHLAEIHGSREEALVELVHTHRTISRINETKDYPEE